MTLTTLQRDILLPGLRAYVSGLENGELSKEQVESRLVKHQASFAERGEVVSLDDMRAELESTRERMRRDREH